MSNDREYPTYDEWLAQRGRPSQPPTPVTPKLSKGYREYARASEEEKGKHELHNEYIEGNVYEYGSTEGRPNFGPVNWDQWYDDWDHIGKDYETPFRENREFFVEQIRSHGYRLDGSLSIGRGKRSDHQIWRVVKNFAIFSRTLGRIRYKEIPFACKIASLSYYDFDSLEESVAALLKEATILTQLRHPFVVKAYEYLTLEDSRTQFPFVFVATIMELMDGHLMELMERYENGAMPPDICKIWCRQLVMALDYLHNHVTGPGDTRLRVAHMALHPVNILYKVFDEKTMRYRFKLSDFEECVIFNRNLENGGQPVDLLPDDFGLPYWHQWCAPEVKRAVRETDYDLSTLRTFPNDIYSLGSTLAYALGGLRAGMKAMELYIDYCSTHQIDVNTAYGVIKITTAFDPLARVSAAQLKTNQWLFGIHQNIDLD